MKNSTLRLFLSIAAFSCLATVSGFATANSNIIRTASTNIHRGNAFGFRTLSRRSSSSSAGTIELPTNININILHELGQTKTKEWSKQSIQQLTAPATQQGLLTIGSMILPAILLAKYLLAPVASSSYMSWGKVIGKMVCVDAVLCWFAICGMVLPQFPTLCKKERTSRMMKFQKTISWFTVYYMLSTLTCTGIFMLLQHFGPAPITLPVTVMHGSATSLAEKLIRPTLGLALFDLLSYPVHRLAHSNQWKWTRPLRKWHSQHHKFDGELVATASFYAHPLDFLFSSVLPLIVAYSVAFFGAPTLFASWLPVTVVLQGIAHSRLLSVIDKVPLLKHHDGHHRHPLKNFGITGFADDIFGTTHK